MILKTKQGTTTLFVIAHLTLVNIVFLLKKVIYIITCMLARIIQQLVYDIEKRFNRNEYFALNSNYSF